MAKKSENGKKAEVRINQFNHRMGSQAQKLDDFLLQGGMTLEQLSKKVESTTSRVRSHISHLKSKGHTVNSEKVDDRMVYQLIAK